MSGHSRVLYAALTVFTVACASDSIVAPEREPPAFLIGGTCSNPAQNPPPGQFGFVRVVSCGQTIKFTIPTSLTPTEQTTLVSVIEAWDDLLQSLGSNMPHLTTSGTGNVTIGVSISRTGATTGMTYYCGQADGSPITFVRYPAKPQPMGNCTHAAGFYPIAFHEIGHAIGFGSAWHNQDTQSPAITRHCVMVLPRLSNPALQHPNGEYCEHEIEVLRLAYGLSSNGIDVARHIATGVTVAPVSAVLGQPVTVNVSTLDFSRVNGTFCGEGAEVSSSCSAPIGTGSVTWQSNSPGIVTVSQSGNTLTLTPVAPGTGTIKAQSAQSTQYVISGGFGGSFQVQVSGTVAPHSAAANGVTTNSAIITWVNGDQGSGTTTKVERRVVGQSTWTTVAPGLSAGINTFALSGLSANTQYEVQVRHYKNSIPSAVAVTAPFTTGYTGIPALAAPGGFGVTNCYESVYGSKTYATFDLGWTSGANSPLAWWEIRESTSNNVNSGSIIWRGPGSVTAATAGPFLAAGTTNRYLWIRHIGNGSASSWQQLDVFPIRPALGCGIA